MPKRGPSKMDAVKMRPRRTKLKVFPTAAATMAKQRPDLQPGGGRLLK